MDKHDSETDKHDSKHDSETDKHDSETDKHDSEMPKRCRPWAVSGPDASPNPSEICVTRAI